MLQRLEACRDDAKAGEGPISPRDAHTYAHHEVIYSEWFDDAPSG